MIKIEITTTEDLLLFVKIIRGDDLYTEKIKELVKQLNNSTNKLEEAEKGAENGVTGS